ncbi:hypothetical protein CFP56_039117 [Quercus suber]|uniref:Uncharacterized protein n=1 Tax=Quercus suber TaxID=58331 RepID=A0AAW0LMS2_QUESU
MAGDGHVLSSNSNCSNHNSKKTKDSKNKKKKKKKRGGSKKKMTPEQTLAFKSVSEWVFLDHPSPFLVDDFGVQKSLGKGGEKMVFDLHSHSKCSDGFLSPTKLVEKAHVNGVSFFQTLPQYLKWVLLAFFFFFFFIYPECMICTVFFRFIVSE